MLYYYSSFLYIYFVTYYNLLQIVSFPAFSIEDGEKLHLYVSAFQIEARMF